MEDVYADPSVISCLVKGVGACRLVGLALAYSVVSGFEPDVTC